ncbi:MAG: hypothetical protein ACT4PU_05725 [Planctomycetota bacterium]
MHRIGPLTVKLLFDYEGRVVRLSDERLAHILEHSEMAGLEGALGPTLERPEAVMQSLSDPQVRLYYRYHLGTLVGDKFVCVVVKLAQPDAFVVTAYLTDRIKRGVPLWTGHT